MMITLPTGLCNPKVAVCRRCAYTIFYEQVDDNTIVHCDFHEPLTASVFRSFKADSDALFEMHGGPVHAVPTDPHNGDYAKWTRFVAAGGFKFNSMLTSPRDGITRPWFTRA